MKRIRVAICLFVALGCLDSSDAQQGASGRWSEAKAQAWYEAQPWMVGANYIPSDAINEFEMFQVASFNPGLIDKELGLGESIGMNTMRVFLQDQLWLSNPKDFTNRLDSFLSIAARHHIRVMLVLLTPAGRRTRTLDPNIHPSPVYITPAGHKAQVSSACLIAPLNQN